MATNDEIKQFLESIRNADQYNIILTKKNQATRFLLGLTTEEQEDIIINLKVDEYYKGPEEDKDRKTKELVWVFKHQHNKDLLYIKLKEPKLTEGIVIVICISLHLDNININ